MGLARRVAAEAERVVAAEGERSLGDRVAAHVLARRAGEAAAEDVAGDEASRSDRVRERRVGRARTQQQRGGRNPLEFPMIYLLDVNALVALGFSHHEFHDRVASWIQTEKFPPVATCSITELGFVRVLAQAPGYGFSVVQARTLLQRLKKSPTLPHTFIPDDHDISHLPTWVKTPKQTTDGHLIQLAPAHGAVLATLDERIPGAYVIPHS